MKTWREIQININLIQCQTERAVLIALPHKSKYDGFTFWHPSKLIKNGTRSACVTMVFSEDFVFHLKKYSRGKYNKILAYAELNPEDIVEAFKAVDDTNKVCIASLEGKVHTPAYIEPVKNPEPLQELTDD